MKTAFTLLLGLLLLGGCQEPSAERYTQNAPEIDLYKNNFSDYSSQNWEGLRAYYADTAKLYFNSVRSEPMTIDDAIEENRRMAEMLSDYGFVGESEEYERVITDDGEMWVNYWGIWYGVVPSSGKRVEIPVHLTARFVDSKIVQENGYWDTMPIYTAMIEADAASAEAAFENDQE